MHARYYSPVVGRFLSVDPDGVDLTRPQSWNRYSYVLNNPVNLTDPTGRCVWDLCIGEFALAAEGSAAAAAAYVYLSNPANVENAIAVAGSAWNVLSEGVDALPSNPDELIDRGYEEKTHPKAAEKGHRTFENPATECGLIKASPTHRGTRTKPTTTTTDTIRRRPASRTNT